MPTKTTHIPLGYQLTITTDAVTTVDVIRLDASSKPTGSRTSVAVSSSARLGPFNEARNYRITSSGGPIVDTLAYSGTYTKDDETNPADKYVFVDNVDDLPTAVSNVITLADDTAYFFTNNIDLNGDRLVGGSNTALLGTSSETATITSTGLGAGVALFTTAGTTPIQNLAFKDVDTAIDITGTGSEAYDWRAVNIVNVPNIGNITDVDNVIITDSAFLSSRGLVIDGDVGTFGVDGSIFTGDGSAGNMIEFSATANVTRRIRFIYSSFVASGSTTALDVDASATVPTEAFILDTINFSGGSTYLGGLDETSNDSLFVNCVGITNTSVNGQLYMRNNATATAVAATDTWYKVAGTTTASADNAKYSHSDNRLTCDATISRTYLIQCSLSFNAGANNQCTFGFYDSALADVRTPSQTQVTANSGGRAESVTFACVVKHSSGDYLEIHAQNNTATADITVTDLNFVITEIK